MTRQAGAGEAPGAITTLGGDLIGSSMMSGITKGTQMIELMNAVGLDIAVVGNHEFDFGTPSSSSGWGSRSFRGWETNVLTGDGQPFPGLVPTQTRKVGDLTIGFLGHHHTRHPPPVRTPGPR